MLDTIMVNENSQAKAVLSSCIKELCEANREIALVTLCTTDGFPISCFSINELILGITIYGCLSTKK